MKNTNPANEVFIDLRKVSERKTKESNTYFIERKMQAKDKSSDGFIKMYYQ